jgi:hypothetical protein
MIVFKIMYNKTDIKGGDAKTFCKDYYKKEEET